MRRTVDIIIINIVIIIIGITIFIIIIDSLRSNEDEAFDRPLKPRNHPYFHTRLVDGARTEN